MKDPREIDLPLGLLGRAAIYALVDPDSQEVRYIGVSNNPPARYIQHFERRYVDENRLTAKEKWIQSLAAEGKYPRMLVIHECAEDEAAEKYKALDQVAISLTHGGLTVQASGLLDTGSIRPCS